MSLESLHEDVYGRLINHEPLTALLSGEKVYDFLPDEETPGPYIVVGETHETEGRLTADSERTVTVRLHIWSSYRGRKEIIQIEREIENAFEVASSEYWFESFLILLDQGGWMHGVVVLRTHMDK
jgi:hypothetical protein